MDEKRKGGQALDMNETNQWLPNVWNFSWARMTFVLGVRIAGRKRRRKLVLFESVGATALYISQPSWHVPSPKHTSPPWLFFWGICSYDGPGRQGLQGAMICGQYHTLTAHHQLETSPTGDFGICQRIAVNLAVSEIDRSLLDHQQSHETD